MVYRARVLSTYVPFLVPFKHLGCCLVFELFSKNLIERTFIYQAGSASCTSYWHVRGRGSGIARP
jgi:hypothetical protein